MFGVEIFNMPFKSKAWHSSVHRCARYASSAKAAYDKNRDQVWFGCSDHEEKSSRSKQLLYMYH